MADAQCRHTGSFFIGGRVVVMLALCCACPQTVSAQQFPPVAERLPNTRDTSFTPLPLKPIRPTRAEAGASFVSKLSANDALFEVIVGQGRLLTLERNIVEPDMPSPLVATGDPTVIDFEIVGPRHIRVTGQRIGITDLSITPSVGETYNMEVHVVADLDFLRASLQQTFPDAILELAHLREHLIVEGQARDSRQVTQIIQMLTAYLESVQVAGKSQGGGGIAAAGAGIPPNQAFPPEPLPPVDEAPFDEAQLAVRRPGDIGPETARPNVRVKVPLPQIINLLHVPGPQQVLLKVQVAELNRTAARQLGVDFLFQDGNTAIGTNPGGALNPSSGGGEAAALMGLLGNPVAAGTTAFGVFNGGKVTFLVDALRRNQVYKILAEPTLVALNGQEASFLSGGEIPYPAVQSGSEGAIGIEWQPYGVMLTFVPYILDGETVRMAVATEVSAPDFALGTTISGTHVPAKSERNTRTVVELRQGQTLAISGLLQAEMEAGTDRIPGLGDLPYIGMMFRNNTSRRVEKELIILVTPHFAEALNADEVPPVPGADVCEANDCEFYLQGRIEGRTGEPFRSTTRWDDPLGLEHRRVLENDCIIGPYGYSP